MKRAALVVVGLLAASTARAQTPPYSANWSELTAPDFAKAMQLARNVCVLPSYPNHYQGDSAGANVARGAASMKARADALARALCAIKADDTSLRLQTEFFEASRRPLDTRQ